MNFKSLIIRLFTFILPLLFAANISAAGDIKVGETIFKGNCAQCHNKNMKDNLTGPALGGAQGRWADDKAIYSWIRNSQAMIASGHPRAIELWAKWKPTAMTAYPNLKDDEIASLLMYIEGVYNGTYGAPAGAVAAAGGAKTTKTDDADFPWWTVGLLSVLALLAFALTRVVTNLNYLADEKDGLNPERKSFASIMTSKGVISFVVFALVVLGGYTTVNNAVSLGRSQGYQPDQPIKFSHATHSGLHKIECQYCHDGARRSKQSVIPAANTCMNCHAAIKKGSKYGTEELSKIYASIGWDPTTNKYIEDYDNKSEAEIETIFKKWITDNYVADKKLAAPDKGAEMTAQNQWNGIKTSLTNPTKPKIQGAIEWIRIHNLPDHAYFNHAQHVAVGQVACQKCHGEVQNMEVVKQYSPLSMGWCINCHRETEVKFQDNDYYKNYEAYHKEFKEGTRSKVTVEEIGGLECQKCHY